MINVTTALIKELRELTGIGIMECKKALIEAQGNIQLAIDNIRKSGHINATKKLSRLTSQGIIITKVTQDSKYGAIIEVNCETDFVVQNNEFKAFSNEIINSVIDERITDLESLKTKFEEKRIALVSKISENINIRRIGFLKGSMISSYLHGTRIGAIVSIDTTNKNLAKNIAMHIVANKPKYISDDYVPQDVIDHEYKIQMDVAMQSGKSFEIAKQIVKGRIRKFLNEISLINQYLVMDSSKTVSQVLSEYDAKINKFILFEIGENINNKIREYSDL